MHHMDCIIVIKGILCKKSIDFSKVTTFENLPVFGVGIAV